MSCYGCKHLRCDQGDRWTPDYYYCDLDMDEEECEEYCEVEIVNEEWERHDAQLQGFDWREARGDYD